MGFCMSFYEGNLFLYLNTQIVPRNVFEFKFSDLDDFTCPIIRITLLKPIFKVFYFLPFSFKSILNLK